MLQRGFQTSAAYAPNLAPMVDVVMVILVFFMLGTSLAVTEGVLPTELPAESGPGGGAAVAVIPIVRISLLEGATGQDCLIYVMGLELEGGSFNALRLYLKEKLDAGADPKGRILIGASPGVRYQDVISAMDACIRAGFSNIQFSVNPDIAVDVDSQE